MQEPFLIDERLKTRLLDLASDAPTSFVLPERLHRRARRRVAIVATVATLAAVLAAGAIVEAARLARSWDGAPAHEPIHLFRNARGKIALESRGGIFAVDPRDPGRILLDHVARRHAARLVGRRDAAPRVRADRPSQRPRGAERRRHADLATGHVGRDLGLLHSGQDHRCVSVPSGPASGVSTGSTRCRSMAARHRRSPRASRGPKGSWRLTSPPTGPGSRTAISVGTTGCGPWIRTGMPERRWSATVGSRSRTAVRWSGPPTERRSRSRSKHPRAVHRVYVVSADGSELTLLDDSRASNPSWSPDGSLIAFIGETCSRRSRRTGHAAGSSPA